MLDAATEITEKNKIRTEKMLNLTERYTMTEEDMGKLAGMLTEEQKQYATEIQDYLTSLGEKGNEISRKLYGLDLFNEEYYFPIKVKSEYLESQTGKTGDPKIKNRGMSKETVPDAQNPLVLQDFMTIVSGHVNDMATYHAFVLPVEDLTRVLNYQPSNAIHRRGRKLDRGQGAEGVLHPQSRHRIQVRRTGKRLHRAADPRSERRRPSRGGRQPDRQGHYGVQTCKYHGVPVGAGPAGLRPFFRAMAYVDPKHFRSLAALDIKGHKEAWEQVEVRQGCRHQGDGRLRHGRGNTYRRLPQLQGLQDVGEREQRRSSFLTYTEDSNYRAEIFGKGAAYADELAWIQMFDACKREQAEKLGKPMDSEEVLEAAGEAVHRGGETNPGIRLHPHEIRVHEIKDTGMKMATAFMAEPNDRCLHDAGRSHPRETAGTKHSSRRRPELSRHR